MPEHLRALIVILALTLPVFWLAKAPICEFAITEADFNRRRNLWLAITIVAFVTQSFWICAVITAALLAVTGARDSSRLGLYLFLLFAVPPFSAQIPGFGGINQLFEVNHPRLLSMVILLPAYLSLRLEEHALPFGRAWADRFLLGYIALPLILQGSVDTVTNTMRFGFYAFVDVFLPYYVASRSLRDLKACRDALMSFVIAALLMTSIAAFEYARYWLLYSSLPGAMGVQYGMGGYMSRGDSLRAVASTGHPIILGYVMVVALALFAFARRSISSRNWSWLGLGALLVGLLIPVSRGPWVGAAAVLCVLMLTGPNKLSRMARLAGVSLPLLAVLLASPMGDKVIDLLPFVGTVDEVNVTYRQRLFEISVDVVMSNPLFGSSDYLSAPALQEMIQGEGIIDMVNSYLGIALAYGLVGLALFSGVFISAAWGTLRAVRIAAPGGEIGDLGRALLAALAGALVTIGTVSSILTVSTIYWLIAGFCVGCANLVTNQRDVASRTIFENRRVSPS
jgi:hypothetical protein